MELIFHRLQLWNLQILWVKEDDVCSRCVIWKQSVFLFRGDSSWILLLLCVWFQHSFLCQKVPLTLWNHLFLSFTHSCVTDFILSLFLSQSLILQQTSEPLTSPTPRPCYCGVPLWPPWITTPSCTGQVQVRADRLYAALAAPGSRPRL